MWGEFTHVVYEYMAFPSYFANAYILSRLIELDGLSLFCSVSSLLLSSWCGLCFRLTAAKHHLSLHIAVLWIYAIKSHGYTLHSAHMRKSWLYMDGRAGCGLRRVLLVPCRLPLIFRNYNLSDSMFRLLCCLLYMKTLRREIGLCKFWCLWKGLVESNNFYVVRSGRRTT